MKADEVMAHRIPSSALTLDDNGNIGVKIVERGDTVAFYNVSIVGDDTNQLNPGIWVTGLRATSHWSRSVRKLSFPAKPWPPISIGIFKKALPDKSMNYLDTAVSRSRTTLSVFVAVMLTGFASYLSIPVELNPDVDVPIIVTTIIHEGISPEDAERLLSKPAELELKTLDGITQISSFSSENAATVITEFDIDFESSTALADVREAINRAKARFPQTPKSL